MKKTVSLILALILVSSALLVSCTGEVVPTGTAPAAEPTGPNRGDVIDNLPELDYDGETVMMYFMTQHQFEGLSYNEFTTDAINMDALNDAIFNREQHVMTRLNVKFKYKYSAEDNVSETLTSSVLTGLDEYQVASESAHVFVENATNGNLQNVMNKERFPYFDFSQPWWASMYIENAMINDALFTLTGDYSLSYIKGMYATFFNKALCEQLGIPDLYGVVNDGEWTIDKQIEFASLAYSDVSGDGKTKDDIFGFGCDNNPDSDVYWAAFDLDLIERNADGEYVIDFDIDHLDSVLTKLSSLYNENKSFLYYTMFTDAEMENDYNNILKVKFSEDELLFMTKTLGMCDNPELRNMKNDYGIITLPKWDTNQDSYYTAVVENYSLLGIPRTVVNTEIVSAVLEALSSDSYRYVTPAYYNKVLKGRYMSDTESTKMIDKITSSYKIDFGVIYSVPLKRLAHQLMRNFLLGENGKSISSFWRSNKKMYSTALSKMIASAEKNAKG